MNRREQEVRRLGEDLDETRRKNRKIEERVCEQIEILQTKLEEYKLDHKRHAESLEDDISTKEDVLTNVKLTLEHRMKVLELGCDNEDSSSIEDSSTDGSK